MLTRPATHAHRPTAADRTQTALPLRPARRDARRRSAWPPSSGSTPLNGQRPGAVPRPRASCGDRRRDRRPPAGRARRRRRRRRGVIRPEGVPRALRPRRPRARRRPSAGSPRAALGQRPARRQGHTALRRPRPRQKAEAEHTAERDRLDRLEAAADLQAKKVKGYEELLDTAEGNKRHRPRSPEHLVCCRRRLGLSLALCADPGRPARSPPLAPRGFDRAAANRLKACRACRTSGPLPCGRGLG